MTRSDDADAWLTFDGRPIPARRGETVAAALTSAGERRLRASETGTPRGLFCGMGVCQECVVTLDGQLNVRACMTKVTGDHTITRQGVIDPLARPAAPIATDIAAIEGARPDLLVLGGGAAGLSAASVAAEAGLDVLLVDERPMPGGQFYKQPAAPHAGDHHADAQAAGGAALIERARRAGVTILSGAEIWGAFPPLEFGLLHNGTNTILAPKRALVATGAYERGLPFPGWTLPGVMTTGAAQTLWRSYRTLAGKRILIAGNGPLNLQVAVELQRGGAEVVAVAELSAAPSTLAGMRMLAADPALALKGVSYLWALKRAGIALHHGAVIGAVEATGSGLAATLRRLDGGAPGAPLATIEVDVVAVGYGFQPQNEILRALGARHHFDPARHHLVTERDSDGATTVAGLYAAGDCCGLGGAPAAVDEGRIAGAAIAASLGRPLAAPADREIAAARRRLPRHRAFQSALWRAFAAPRLETELAEPDTPICRCEGVRRSDIAAAMSDGAASIGEVKRATRLGMGRCQGRYCAPILASLIATSGGGVPHEFSLFAPRAPVKPVAIADLLAIGARPREPQDR
ncbi:FAD-dependent oxidoreductase [Acuticoccus sp. M5D2P5]|uniref:FAD-dependent oxidoreductase n=1 Tax=Acuticoccus kalidii TaxID=2910977 RepID=UPI001F3D055F|nr:FAD-dependent oxidoreductase [Acuticoccus kalidii]MCF3933217.1 FAD-dependent oxidoreductase [Acuticoccus kalidii]